jgi:uncharacterized membrane protein
MARLGQSLAWAAIVVAASVVGYLLMDQYVISVDDDLVAVLSLLGGVVAPVLAILGSVLLIATRRRVSRLAVFALVFGCLAFSWPLLFFLAYSNCPNGVC